MLSMHVLMVQVQQSSMLMLASLDHLPSQLLQRVVDEMVEKSEINVLFDPIVGQSRTLRGSHYRYAAYTSSVYG